MAENRVRVYEKATGTMVEMWAVDAAEALAAGSYSMAPPPAQRGMAFPEPPAEPEAPAPQVQAVEAETLSVEASSGVQAESSAARTTRRPPRS